MQNAEFQTGSICASVKLMLILSIELPQHIRRRRDMLQAGVQRNNDWEADEVSFGDLRHVRVCGHGYKVADAQSTSEGGP